MLNRVLNGIEFSIYGSGGFNRTVEVEIDVLSDSVLIVVTGHPTDEVVVFTFRIFRTLNKSAVCNHNSLRCIIVIHECNNSASACNNEVLAVSGNVRSGRLRRIVYPNGRNFRNALRTCRCLRVCIEEGHVGRQMVRCCTPERAVACHFKRFATAVPRICAAGDRPFVVILIEYCIYTLGNLHIGFLFAYFNRIHAIGACAALKHSVIADFKCTADAVAVRSRGFNGTDGDIYCFTADTVFAFCGYKTVLNSQRTAGDAVAGSTAGGSDLTGVKNNRTVHARAAAGACCGNSAAVNREIAFNACAVCRTGCADFAAVEIDGAGDSITAVSGHDQLAAAAALRIDIELAAVFNGNSFGCIQRNTVSDNQIYRAAYDNRLVTSDALVRNIPAVIPYGRSTHNGLITAALRHFIIGV